MHTEPHHGEARPHKNKHLAEKFEGMLGVLMVLAIVLLVAGLIWGVMSGDGGTPKYLQ
jgi:hypothetical protein